MIAAALGLALLSPGVADAGRACVRTEFKTDLYENACKKGGQQEAKKAARSFMKKAKKASGEKLTCKSCHSQLAPGYPLQADGFEQLNRLKRLMLRR